MLISSISHTGQLDTIINLFKKHFVAYKAVSIAKQFPEVRIFASKLQKIQVVNVQRSNELNKEEEDTRSGERRC